MGVITDALLTCLPILSTFAAVHFSHSIFNNWFRACNARCLCFVFSSCPNGRLCTVLSRKRWFVLSSAIAHIL